MTSKKHPIYDWINVYSDGRIETSRGFLKPRPTKNGYLNVVIQSVAHGVVVTKGIHRLVAETFILNPDNKPEVHHTDDDKHHNHFSNLKWVTKKEAPYLKHP